VVVEVVEVFDCDFFYQFQVSQHEEGGGEVHVAHTSATQRE
jgi:hypothetical protein